MRTLNLAPAITLVACFHLLTFASGAKAGPTLIVNITDSSVVGDIVTVKVQATSEAGITKVEFSVDDQIKSTSLKAPYEYKWDTVDEEEGRHTLIINAYDGAGSASTKRIKVEVDNELSKGVKPHAEKAFKLFREDDYDGTLLEGRKAHKIDMANLEAIQALAAGRSGARIESGNRR